MYYTRICWLKIKKKGKYALFLLNYFTVAFNNFFSCPWGAGENSSAITTHLSPQYWDYGGASLLRKSLSPPIPVHFLVGGAGYKWQTYIDTSKHDEVHNSGYFNWYRDIKWNKHVVHYFPSRFRGLIHAYQTVRCSTAGWARKTIWVSSGWDFEELKR